MQFFEKSKLKLLLVTVEGTLFAREGAFGASFSLR